MATDNAKMNKAGTMRKVLSYMKRYIPLLVISLALSVVTVALTLYFPILTGRAIDLIVGKGKVDFSAMTAILTRAAIIVVIAAAAQWLTNICDEDENLIVSAMSQWCIVDFETRKLVRSALEFSGEYIDIPAFEEKIEKIKYSDPQAAGAHTVTEEDLDINCHVNNCRYADMTSEILDRNDFQSFTINFLKETVVGDRIDMFMERAEDGSDIVVGMLEDESVVFQAKVTYL